MDRRSFLGALGATTLAGLTSCTGASESPRAVRRVNLGPIGVQLYTVRGEMARDFDATLARVAEIGYREVEFAGYFEKSAAEVRAALGRAGLDAPSGHFDLTAMEQRRDETIEFARAVGHRHLVVPWLPAERRRTLDDYRRLARLFNDLGDRSKAAGMTFAFHNHDVEFLPLEDRIPFDVLAEETDPNLVKLQLDLYWITRAGQRPLDYFTRYPGRFPTVHVKDSAGPPEHRMVDVGAGVIDWRSLLLTHRERAGIRHVFVEHDEPADPFASIAASFRYLSNLKA